MIQIESLDHLVLTVADLQRSIDFYTQILGMQEITFGNNRKALLFGKQKNQPALKRQRDRTESCRRNLRFGGFMPADFN
jgi:catechol 2,3-dioxygenase-like lactoylglutathione lyase family enzyme